MHDVEFTTRRVARLAQAVPRAARSGPVPVRRRDGEPDIDSDDVNDYLHEVSGDDFTAKDFRTWAGTVLAAWAFGGSGPGSKRGASETAIVDAVKFASHLGNTPAICRRSYVHPAVLDGHLDGSLGDVLEKEAARKL